MLMIGKIILKALTTNFQHLFEVFLGDLVRYPDKAIQHRTVYKIEMVKIALIHEYSFSIGRCDLAGCLNIAQQLRLPSGLMRPQ